MSIHILGIFGSLRQESSNQGLVKLAQKLAPTAVTFTLYDKIGLLPFYNEDLEDSSHTPTSVIEWRNLVTSADALFIAAPEYNFGPSAVLKNAIDWATRPMGQHALSRKVISLISSSGGTGGAHMIEQLGGILGLLGNTVISEPNGQIPKGADRISANGSTSDPAVEALVGARVQALIETVESLRK
ncbi:MAG: NADPH-dependent FMN reductase [Actinomycetes bacterium]